MAADLFERFRTRHEIRAITVDAIREITALEWTRIEARSEIPNAPGVYVWATREAPHAVVYIGSASSAVGLSDRVGEEIGWRNDHGIEVGKDALRDEPASMVVLARAPFVRVAFEDDLIVFVAETAQPQWSLDKTAVALPETPEQWEGFLTACAHIVSGRRASIGGGAWNQKATTVAEQMFPAAWARLHDLKSV
ncbi:hypothetical protein [Microbacterium dextranolyticum]|uniref:Uncharacterized protein n=1 Tax=Microbacterium dextranolyticum TaxID=36806 RepID=A0A9W6HM52_9MICO|nr:hypothetical protein [Microbacterium dextranolyticum]MBM7463172.1 hypothetical protein [Microbacterium dextranolyticum]GLJ95722.1 hypothetical protein GCM10017591_17850 [Microbacterium dextranolyticum]